MKESSTPWMAPEIFMKKSIEICLCMDYRELNRRTTNDTYPLPLPDEVQDRLTESTIFSGTSFIKGRAYVEGQNVVVM